MMRRRHPRRLCQLAMLACTLTQCALLSGCFGATRAKLVELAPDLPFTQPGEDHRGHDQHM